MNTREIHSWIADDTQDNSLATATKAAPTGGLSHFVTSVAGSFSGSVTGKTLVLKDGTTEIARWHVYDAFALVLPSPVKLSPATAANLELQASGTGGTNGSVVMTGYTQ